MTQIMLENGELADAKVLHVSPRGLYFVAKLTGTGLKGTVDVFHEGTGKRATPPRHFSKVRTQAVARAVADDLDVYDPVAPDGTLRVTREEYHAHFDELIDAIG